MTQAAPARSAAVKGGSAIAAAIGVMNVSTYLFTIVAARLMGPRPFGAFAAMMNVLLVASVLSLALQATAARRIAREPGDVHEVERTILLVGRRSAIVLGLVFLALAPAINLALKLDSLATAVVLAIVVVPTTLMGGQAGVLQGERRWLTLALVYLAAGLPRMLIGSALLLWRPTEFVALVAVAIGSLAPVAIGAIALRERRARDSAGTTADHSARALWWETVHNTQALLAFLVISSVDIVVARNALDFHDAGLYAGGLIMVKAVMFLPQFVVVLAFPSMGTDEAPRRALLASLALVAVTGVVVTVGVRVLPSLALTFVGGEDYQGISDKLWVFAILGTVLSMLQLIVYSVLARQARKAVLLLWLALVPFLVLGLTSDSVIELATRVLAVDSFLLAVLLALTLVRLRSPEGPAARPAG